MFAEIAGQINNRPWNIVEQVYIFNGSQLAKMKKSIPDMPLP